MKTIKGYKFIKADMFSKEGNHQWVLGKWYKEDEIKLCEKGFHACRTALQSLDFIYGDKWFIVEARGKFKEEKDKKFVASEMRLIKELPIDRIVKRFALWCAKDCLKNYTKYNSKDTRVADCIRITEDCLDGKATLDELTAAESAAWSAARSARSAAWSAARSARSAAWSAAESAARSAESAARSAESAAWSARSAESAAESAARSARSAESAAWSAALKRQSKALDKIIKKEQQNQEVKI